MTKVPDHVGFVPQKSTDKIGDLSADNRIFCLQVCNKPQAEFTPENEWNANAACENEAIVQRRRVTEARQTAFGCAKNVPQTAE